MKTINKLTEYTVRIELFLSQHNYSFTARKLVSWLHMSTLVFNEKMKLLKTRPESEAEINLILEILQSNYQIDQVDRRNKEWQLLLIDDHPDAKCAIHKKQQLELIQ